MILAQLEKKQLILSALNVWQAGIVQINKSPVKIVQKVSTNLKMEPHIVYHVYLVNSKTLREHGCVSNVLKIRSPTAVECRLVMLAGSVKKQNKVVSNVPNARLVKRGPVTGVHVKNVPRVNLASPRMKQLLARLANLVSTKKNKDKQRVTNVF